MTTVVQHGWSDGSMLELSHEGRVEQAARAQAIAVIAHRGQTDKLGADYMGHVTAVAFRFDPLDQTLECCAAWLHDVIEDTDITADDLDRAGIHPEVINVVDLLTRKPGDGDECYLRIRENPAARAVKYADLLNNTDPYRTERLPAALRERLRAKYDHAFQLLGFSWPNHWEEGQAGWAEFGNERLYRVEDDEVEDDDEDAGIDVVAPAHDE